MFSWGGSDLPSRILLALCVKMSFFLPRSDRLRSTVIRRICLLNTRGWVADHLERSSKGGSAA